MSATAARRVAAQLRPGGASSDAELVLALSGATRDDAFAELVRRYGPMVLGVCRHALHDAHAADDAFQAVFLVLARKAGTIRPPGAVGGWLYGVAVRTARKARTAAARRRRHEMAAHAARSSPASREHQRPEASHERAELRTILDAELAALPDAHRAAVVLCDLHGKTRAEAAAELACPEGTVASWLARGRAALARRLARRGVALPAAGLAAVVAPATVSAELSSAAAGLLAGRGVSESVLALAEGVMRSLSTSTKLVAACAAGVVLAAVASAAVWPMNPEAPPNPPGPRVASPAASPKPDAPGVLDHGGSVYSVSYAPAGRSFLSVGGGSAVVWDAELRKVLFRVEAEFAAFSGDGKSVFVLAGDEFRTLDAATGKGRTAEPRRAPKPVPGRGRWAAIEGGGDARVEFDGVRHHLTDLFTFADKLPVLGGQGATDPKQTVRAGVGGAFAPRGSWFAGTHAATGNKETNCLTVWDVGDGKRVGTIYRGEKFFHPVQAFAWSPDGKALTVGYMDGVRVYDSSAVGVNRIRNGEDPDVFKELRAFGDAGDATAVAYSPDGKTLAVAVREGVGAPNDSRPGERPAVATAFAVVLLDATTGKQLRRFEGFAQNLPVVSLAFRPDGKELLCGAGFFPGAEPPAERKPAKGANGLRVLKLAEPPAQEPPPGNPRPEWKPDGQLTGAGDRVSALAASPDGKSVAAATDTGVTCWDVATRKPRWEFDTKGGAHAVAFSPDGRHLCAATETDVLRFDATTGRPAPWADGGAVWFGRVTALAYHPGGARLAAGDGYRTVVRQLDAAGEAASVTGAPGLKAEAGTRVAPLAWSPDGKRLALARNEPADGKYPVTLWGAARGARADQLPGHANPVAAVAWSPDGKVVASAASGAGEEAGETQDGTLILWDAATGKERRRVAFRGRDGGRTEVFAVAFSPDSATVAVAVRLGSGKSQNRVARIDAATGKEVGVLFPGGGAAVTGVAWSPDGTRVYGATAGGVAVWARKP